MISTEQILYIQKRTVDRVWYYRYPCDQVLDCFDEFQYKRDNASLAIIH